VLSLRLGLSSAARCFRQSHGYPCVRASVRVSLCYFSELGLADRLGSNSFFGCALGSRPNYVGTVAAAGDGILANGSHFVPSSLCLGLLLELVDLPDALSSFLRSDGYFFDYLCAGFHFAHFDHGSFDPCSATLEQSDQPQLICWFSYTSAHPEPSEKPGFSLSLLDSQSFDSKSLAFSIPRHTFEFWWCASCNRLCSALVLRNLEFVYLHALSCRLRSHSPGTIEAELLLHPWLLWLEIVGDH